MRDAIARDSPFAPEPGLLGRIQADHARLRPGARIPRLLVDAVFHKTFRVLCSYRLYRQARISPRALWRISAPIFMAYHRWTCLGLAAEIAWQAEIGAGCRILHGFGMVILPCARIGRGVTLTHGTIVGYRASPEAPEAPRSVGVVEDHCFVGPYAMVWARMGAGSVLAPHSVLMHDAPPRSVLVGSPAKVKRTLGAPRPAGSPPGPFEAANV